MCHVIFVGIRPCTTQLKNWIKPINGQLNTDVITRLRCVFHFRRSWSLDSYHSVLFAGEKQPRVAQLSGTNKDRCNRPQWNVIIPRNRKINRVTSLLETSVLLWLAQANRLLWEAFPAPVRDRSLAPQVLLSKKFSASLLHWRHHCFEFSVDICFYVRKSISCALSLNPFLLPKNEK